MALKVKFRTLFPAVVSALSPITLIKTGFSYAFGLDVAALRTSLDPYYGSMEKLTADRSYYVRTDGNNANDGLVDSTAGAWQTLQYADNFIRNSLEIPTGITVTVQVKDGAYSGALVINGPHIGGGNVVYRGNPAAPVNCIVSPTGVNAFTVKNARVTITGFGIITDGGFAQVYAGEGSQVSVSNLRHGDAGGAGDHMQVTDGGLLYLAGNYAFGGAYGSHIHFRRGGRVMVPNLTTITATAFGVTAASNYFVGGNAALADLSGMTWSGSAVTGSKFLLHNGCRLNTGTGGNLSWLPGSTPGTFPDAWAWYDNMFCGATGLSAGAPFAADALVTANANTAATAALSFAAQLHTVGANAGVAGIASDAYGTLGYNLDTARISYGTAAAPTVVNTAVYVKSFVAKSLDSTGAFGDNCAIDFAAANSQTGTDHGGFMRGRVTPPGSTTLTEVWRAGTGFMIGTTSDPGAGGLNVQTAYYLGGTLLKNVAETLTNKSLSLGSNTVTGTTAQFNTALSDGDFATLAGVEALTNKTLNGNTFTTGTYTITGTAGKTLTFSNTITLSGTDGTTMTLPATSATVARTDAGQTFTGTQVFSSTITGSISGNAATVTTNANLIGPITSVGNTTSIASQTGTGTTFVMSAAPTIAGGLHTAITSLGIRSTGAAFDLTFACTEVLTAGRTLTIKLNDAARTVDIAGNVTLAGALTTSGAFASTFTMTGTTTVTFPTTGTLATLAGTEEFTNKTLNASVGKGTWTASGTWTLPAHTLGGTISGGGNQINNVVIGASTPLAITGTTITANTSFTAANGSSAGLFFNASGGTADAQIYEGAGGAFAVKLGTANQLNVTKNDNSSVIDYAVTTASTVTVTPAFNTAAETTVRSGTATPAGGSTSARLLFGTTAGFGVYYGSGTPTVSAGQGSIYLRSDGSSASTRLYVNTNGSTTWTNVTTAA